MKSYRKESSVSWGINRIEDLNVIEQGFSPRSNGILVLRPNRFRFVKEVSVFKPIKRYDKEGKVLDTISSRIFVPSLGHIESSFQELQRVRDEASNKMLQKVSGIRVNALELYATRIQTVNTVAKRIGQLTQAFLALKRGKWKQFKRHLGLSKSLKRPGARKFEDVPGLWLEYSFGWVPLVSDVYTILNNTFEPPRNKVEAVYKVNSQRPFNRESRAYVQYGDLSVFHRCTATVEVSVDVPALSAISQYGINNPLAVAWELVPYSFVVDWFLPVGDYIEQLGATAGLSLTSYSSTLTSRYILSYENDINKSQRQQGYHRVDVASCFFDYRVKNRILGPVPSYKFLVPENPMDQSLRRVSYALSLLSLAFSRKRTI